MFNNIDFIEINKSHVKHSLWVPFISVFLMLFIIGTMQMMAVNQMPGLLDLAALTLMLIFVGVVVWLPALLICLFIERFWIKPGSSRKSVTWILGVELFVPVLILLLVAKMMSVEISGKFVLIALGVSFLAQFMRWIYLNTNQRLYNTINKPLNV